LQTLLQTTQTHQLTSAFQARALAAVLTALGFADAILGTQLVNLFTHSRPGIQLVTGVIILGVIGIVIVIVYVVVASFGNNIPTGTLSAGQQSTLTTLINATGNSLSLVSVLEIVVAAGLIIGGIFAFLHFAR